jgi:site-specific DNA recombinase
MLGPPWTTATPAAYVRTAPLPRSGDEMDADAQRRAIERHVKSYEMEEPEWFVDDNARGDDLDRVGLRRLLTSVRRGEVSTVLVARANRLSTHLADVLAVVDRYLEPNDASLVSVTERIDTSTDRGKRLLEMLRSFEGLGGGPRGEEAGAASDADARTEEARRLSAEARREKAEAGEHVAGRIPYGYTRTDDGDVEPDPDEAPVVRRIFRLRDEDTTLRAIADALNEDDVPAPSGGTWRASTVQYLLDNEIYHGYRTYTIDGDTVTQDVPRLQIVK